MVEKLKSYIMKAEGYQAQPVRRVYIPQSAAPLALLCAGGAQQGERRPLVIPTITDRCLQALVNLVLEPLVEMNSDKHSYGFRKYRSAKMAVGRLFFVLTHQHGLRSATGASEAGLGVPPSPSQGWASGSSSATGEAAPPSYKEEAASPLQLHPRLPLPLLAPLRTRKGTRKGTRLRLEKKQISSEPESLPELVYYYVLDADIKGFFDKISHEWLLNHVPLERTLMLILRGWLKAGTIYKDQEVEYGVSGTPQGGIISPTLVNFTLNGLELSIEQAVQREYKVRKRGIYIGKVTIPGEESFYLQRAKYEFLTTNLATIRFADEFIVLARSRRMIEETIRPHVERFLSERGITLSPEKTKVLSVINSESIDFQGYSFAFRERVSPKSRMFMGFAPDKLGRQGIACYPQKKKYQAIMGKLKAIIAKSTNLTAATLIAKLNPIIRG